MKTIWKFELDPKPGTEFITMPKNSVPLTVQLQDGRPVMWALVETGNRPDRLMVMTYFTGQGVDWFEGVSKYIGTYQIGGLVYHVGCS